MRVELFGEKVRYGIPVRGTHAHSWVMSFATERQAFDAYADAMPHNGVLLVDTYDTLEGVRTAIETGRRLRERGCELLGIRLDSGDLAWLSLEARRILDAEGFSKTQIIASNELDEHLIESLVQQGAAIDAWGVGTKLVTAFDEPAMDGVYKLGMISENGGPLEPRIKLSEQAAKISNPGVQQVRRWKRQGRMVADVIFDEGSGLQDAVHDGRPARSHTTARALPRARARRFAGAGRARWPAARGVAPGARDSRTRVPRARTTRSGRAAARESARVSGGLSTELYTERVRLIQQARRARLPRWGAPRKR